MELDYNKSGELGLSLEELENCEALWNWDKFAEGVRDGLIATGALVAGAGAFLT